MDEPDFETPPEYADTELLQLRVHKDLYRAFQRCMWIIIHETGRSQMEVMDEVVRDFLIKHQC
ncbi:MAG: hypothetical protein ACOY8P_04965 [Thermodesulfobacteriota bacterium]